MFKSLTFQICRIVMFKILIKILATLRLRYRVKTSRVFTSVYNAFCILYLWDITLFSHGVGILMILNTFSCMMLMSTGQLWSSYKVNLQVWYVIICWCGEPVLYVYDKLKRSFGISIRVWQLQDWSKTLLYINIYIQCDLCSAVLDNYCFSVIKCSTDDFL